VDFKFVVTRIKQYALKILTILNCEHSFNKKVRCQSFFGQMMEIDSTAIPYNILTKERSLISFLLPNGEMLVNYD